MFSLVTLWWLSVLLFTNMLTYVVAQAVREHTFHRFVMGMRQQRIDNKVARMCRHYHRHTRRSASSHLRIAS